MFLSKKYLLDVGDSEMTTSFLIYVTKKKVFNSSKKKGFYNLIQSPIGSKTVLDFDLISYE